MNEQQRPAAQQPLDPSSDAFVLQLCHPYRSKGMTTQGMTKGELPASPIRQAFSMAGRRDSDGAKAEHQRVTVLNFERFSCSRSSSNVVASGDQE